jgi:nifR3 family TIM-barrel protein
MPKVTRKGGGAALPVRRRLLAEIVAAAVRAAEPNGVPVTVKFRIGIDDRIRTSVDTGRIAESEGAAAVALHARTAEQCYAGEADWAAIAELKAAVQTIPVLGNGDVWEAADAIRMVEATGCDGVVIGRGCLGRPWLFADLAAAFAATSGTPRTPGRPAAGLLPERQARSFGFVAATMLRHAELLTLDEGEDGGARSFRRHAAWYLQGYPVGTEVRRRAAMVSSLAELSAILGNVRLPRGHTEGPRPVHLPDGWLDLIDDPTPPEGAELLVSGG